MSAQDLEQRAQFEEWVRKRHGLSVEVWDDSGKYKYGNTHHFWECWKVAAALRQQPAPVDLEHAQASVVYQLEDDLLVWSDTDEATFNWWRNSGRRNTRKLYTAPHQPAPVVDDAMRELIEAAKRVCAAWNSGNPPELKRIGEREYHSPAGSMLDATEIAPLYAALARAQGVQS